MACTSTIEAEAIALQALAAVMSDERRARRFLDLSGIGTDDLRSRVNDPALLHALLVFLEGHEPDLVAVAGLIGVTPADLVSARQRLEQ